MNNWDWHKACQSQMFCHAEMWWQLEYCLQEPPCMVSLEYHRIFTTLRQCFFLYNCKFGIISNWTSHPSLSFSCTLPHPHPLLLLTSCPIQLFSCSCPMVSLPSSHYSPNSLLKPKYWFWVWGEGYDDMSEYIKVEMRLVLCIDQILAQVQGV